MGEAVASNIAKEFNIGNTKIKIATDYCNNKTQDDIEIILMRIAKSALQSFNAKNTQQ